MKPVDRFVAPPVDRYEEALKKAEVEAKKLPTLKEGARGADVIDVQKKLQNIGVDPGPVDGKFGPRTESAVKDFQRKKDLKPTGVVNAETAKELYKADAKHDHVFIEGERSASVGTAERRLRRLGYDVGKADGYFDANTREAVQAFRKDEGLKSNGSLTSKVRGQLRSEAGDLRHDAVLHRVKETKGQERLDDATTKRIESGDGLSVGARGRVIENVQQRLARAGFDPGHVDGVFDERTAGALKAFQRHAGLNDTGVVNGASWKKLDGTLLQGNGPTAPAQRLNEQSGAVKRSEKMLKELGFNPGNIDGAFNKATQKAVEAFQKKHDKLDVNGRVSSDDFKAMQNAIEAKSGHGPLSGSAKKQMANLVRVAQSMSGGQSPGGYCLGAVQDMLEQVSYGKAGHGAVQRFPYARNYAEFMNEGKRYEDYGLRKLDIDNPYDAPPGSIIVVRPGTPGTSHPTAGDIVVKGYGDTFYNDGEMGYGGSGNFPPGNDYVLGIYAPR